MKQLTQYKKNGNDFSVIKRSGNIGIFRENKYNSYEVIVIQSHNGREIAGNYCPPAEFAPSNEQWGAKGWTYCTEDEALKKYNELCKNNLTNPH